MRMKQLSLILLSGAILSGTAGAVGLAGGASKFVGNITTRGQVQSDFGTYWNQITAENECKWASVEGTRGKYNFSGCKNAYNWAKTNGGHFKFHALVWGSQYPSWLNGLSADDTKKAITAWFDAVKKEFPDLEMIDVVNEAIRTGAGKYHSGYGNGNNIIPALGGDNNGDYTFVTTAFKMARERWPNAVLIYNDYNTFQWQKNEGIDLINKIKAAGAPVDAYGQQGHDMMSQGGGAGGTGGGGVCLNYNTFKSTLQEIYDKTKIPLVISEYDIGTSDDQIQLQCYKEQITAFMEAPYVAGITLWGYIYGATWTTDGNSGIIRNGKDRPAMTWLKEYLAKNKGVNTTGLLGGEPAKPDTVPQAAYKGAIAIPGTLEAENYDVGGQTQSYYDADASNQGEAYRQDAVDVVAVANNGYAVGYGEAGEWLEYTVNVAVLGTYDFEVLAASGADGSSIRLFIDGKAVSDTIKIANGGDWDTYGAVSGTTTDIAAGTHVLKIAMTGNYANIDNIKFVKSGSAKVSGSKGLALGPRDYKVFSVSGRYLSSFQAKSEADLRTQMQASSLNRGLYFARGMNSDNMLINISK